jgi:hypothetical protein
MKFAVFKDASLCGNYSNWGVLGIYLFSIISCLEGLLFLEYFLLRSKLVSKHL